MFYSPNDGLFSSRGNWFGPEQAVLANGKTPWCSCSCVSGQLSIRLPGSLLTLRCSWFSYVWGLFSSPPPIASALHSYKNGEPFISSPATVLLPWSLVSLVSELRPNCLSTRDPSSPQQRSVSQVWWMISTEEEAMYTVISTAIMVRLRRRRIRWWQRTWACRDPGTSLCIPEAEFSVFRLQQSVLSEWVSILCGSPGKQGTLKRGSIYTSHSSAVHRQALLIFLTFILSLQTRI